MTQDHKELKARRACRDPRVMPDLKVHRGHKVIKGHREFRDRPELMELTGRLCSMERRILTLGRASMETSTSTQHQTRSSDRRPPVPGQHPAHRLSDRRGTKAIRETLVTKARRVIKGHRDHKVSRVYRVLKVM